MNPTKPIDLHTIFRHLVDDDNFLLTIRLHDDVIKQKKPQRQPKNNLMNNVITQYEILPPGEMRTYDTFPKMMQNILIPKFIRYGIHDTFDRDREFINISFLNSLSILLRFETYNYNSDDRNKNYLSLEDLICNHIKQNSQIDKVKNTKKVQKVNQAIVNNIKKGIIEPDVIQYIVNIFEINLIIFDIVNSQTIFYWAKGIKYPYLNPFKEIYFMVQTERNYEPLRPTTALDTNERIYIYGLIFANLDTIKYYSDLKIALHTLTYINTWNIPCDAYMKILSKLDHVHSNVIDTVNKINAIEDKYNELKTNQ